MYFSQKAKFQLFTLLIFLNLILRQQLTLHETGIDSFEMHMLANSLSTFGEARWWVHPLSIIGMYPNSYASAISFLISGISQITGLDIEKAVLMYSLIGSPFVVFASYILAGTIYDDDCYKFIVAYTYSLSPGIIEYTTWTAQGRSLFMIILPIFFFLLLRSRFFKVVYIFPTILIFLFIMSSHHLFFYLIPIVGIYLILLFMFHIKKHISLPKIIYSVTPLILLSSFLAMFAYPFITYKFMTNISRWVNLANLPVEYPRYSGFAVFLSFGGLIYIIFKKDRSFSEWFIMISLMIMTVFIFQTMYTKWIMILFVALFAGRAYLNIFKLNLKNSKYSALSIILFLVISVSFAGYFELIKEYDYRVIDENTFETGLWIKKNLDGVGIGNSRWDTWKIGAISAKPILTGSSSTDQAYGLVNTSDFELATHSITSEEFWLDSPYYRISGKVSDSYWQLIHAQYYSSKGYQYINYFNIVYLIDLTEFGNNWFSHHGNGLSNFVIQVHEEKNCIYDSGKWNLWNI